MQDTKIHLMSISVALSLNFLLVLCFISSYGQSEPAGLKVGDTMEDYRFSNLINHPSSSARLSDFGKKMIILEFWSTSCATCIESWPKLLNLQTQFANDLQIILVNSHQGEKAVRAIIEKRKQLAHVDMNLPTVCGDSVLSNLFPRSGVPHVVWIDQEHMVRSITSISPLNEKNIRAMLADPSTKLPQKASADFELLGWNPLEPLFLKNNGGTGDQLKYTSLLSGYVDGLLYDIGMFGNLSTQRFKKIAGTNQTIPQLYGFAYSQSQDEDGRPAETPASRIKLNVINNDRFLPYRDGTFLAANHYCYELIMDTTSKEELRRRMQEDLSNYFPYKASWKKKRMKCLILTMTDSSKVSTPNGGTYLQGINHSMFNLNGAYSNYQIIKWLEELYSDQSVPVIDETGYAGRLYNIELDVNTKDPAALDRALKPLGLRLQFSYRKIPVLIISDQKAKDRSGGYY